MASPFVNSIRTYSEKKLIGYTREQLFDVVAAVENYYLFVPACRRSDVVQRSPDKIKAKLEIGIPPLLEAYTSNVKLDKPRLITASCIEGHLFKHLETRWRFRQPPRPYSPNESNTTIKMETTICNSIQVNNTSAEGESEAGPANSRNGCTRENESNSSTVSQINDQEKESTISPTNLVQHSQQTEDVQHQKIPPPSTNNNRSDKSNIIFKRCKHGRIIIKDLSKKKLVQQDDNDETTKINQLEKTEQTTTSNEKNLSPHTDDIEKVVNIELKLTDKCEPDEAIKNINNIVNNPSNSDKYCEPKERDQTEVKCSTKQEATDSKKTSSSRRPRSKSKSPISSGRYRRKLSPSPTRRKSPRRHGDRNSYRRRSRSRSRSRSPRARRESSRERSSRKNPHSTNDSRGSSSRRHRTNSRQDPSPPSGRDRRSSRNNKSLRRRHSESSSESSRSPTNVARRHTHRGNSKSPESRRDKYTRNTGIDISRDSIFGKTPNKPIDLHHKDSSSNAATSTNQSGREHQMSKSQSINSGETASTSTQQPLQPIPSSGALLKSPPTTAQPQRPASPNKSPLSNTSMSPSSNDSPSSEIYDPEGPIISISPCDSPPISPSIKAANNINNNANNHHNHNNHNHNQNYTKSAYIDTRSDKGNAEDDVPSSAVELNKKEKYLQKLNRQERVVEEIKIALKPHYQKRAITKEQYKDVLRRAVPKICHSKDGEINPVKIRKMVDAYAKKMKRKNLNR